MNTVHPQKYLPTFQKQNKKNGEIQKQESAAKTGFQSGTGNLKKNPKPINCNKLASNANSKIKHTEKIATRLKILEKNHMISSLRRYHF
jgi:hypothetical protein